MSPSATTIAVTVFELVAFVGMVVVLFSTLGHGGFNPSAAARA
jgi:hypothetical protein